jgi:hypothetical protein
MSSANWQFLLMCFLFRPVLVSLLGFHFGRPPDRLGCLNKSGRNYFSGQWTAFRSIPLIMPCHNVDPAWVSGLSVQFSKFDRYSIGFIGLSCWAGKRAARAFNIQTFWNDFQ